MGLPLECNGADLDVWDAAEYVDILLWFKLNSNRSNLGLMVNEPKRRVSEGWLSRTRSWDQLVSTRDARTVSNPSVFVCSLYNSYGEDHQCRD